MNILYIDTFLQSMNHSNSLMPKLFKKVGNVDFYGPGYVSNRILASGINKFIELRNEYSFLVIGPNFPVFLNDKKLKYGNISEYLNWIKRYNVTGSNKKIIKDFLNDILDTLNTIPIKNKILNLFLLDVYAVNNDQLNSFQEKGFYILAQNKILFLQLMICPIELKRETFYSKKK